MRKRLLTMLTVVTLAGSEPENSSCAVPSGSYACV